MLCPYCQHEETKVVDSRDINDSTRRRRECEKCAKRFTTYERPDIIDLFVIKKSGEKQAFDKEKLKSSIKKACEKTSTTEQQINEWVDKIELQLRKHGTIDIQSKIIGDLVIKCLKKYDEVAYLRFASVYKQFSDAKDFKDEIKNL